MVYRSSCPPWQYLHTCPGCRSNKFCSFHAARRHRRATCCPLPLLCHSLPSLGRQLPRVAVVVSPRCVTRHLRRTACCPAAPCRRCAAACRRRPAACRCHCAACRRAAPCRCCAARRRCPLMSSSFQSSCCLSPSSCCALPSSCRVIVPPVAVIVSPVTLLPLANVVPPVAVLPRVLPVALLTLVVVVSSVAVVMPPVAVLPLAVDVPPITSSCRVVVSPIVSSCRESHVCIQYKVLMRCTNVLTWKLNSTDDNDDDTTMDDAL